MDGADNDEDLLLALAFSDDEGDAAVASGGDPSEAPAVLSLPQPAAAPAQLAVSSRTVAATMTPLATGFAAFVAANSGANSAGSLPASSQLSSSAARTQASSQASRLLPNPGALRPPSLGATRPPARQALADVDLANVEQFSMLSIRDRLIPAADLQVAMLGRNLHTIRTISTSTHAKLGAGAGGGADRGVDWLTIGVLASKSAPRSSDKSQGNYMSWTISDFRASINILLFGEAYTQHWREAEGSIVLISCPVLLPAKDGKALLLSVKRGAQITRLGTSSDFGICKGKRKADGAPCTVAINVRQGAYCAAHIAPEYKREMQRALVSRPDMTGGGSGKIVAATRVPGSSVPVPAIGTAASSKRTNLSDGVYGFEAKRLIARQAAVVPPHASGGPLPPVPMSQLATHSVCPDEDGYGYSGALPPGDKEERQRTGGAQGPYRAAKSHVVDVRGAAGLKVRVSGDGGPSAAYLPGAPAPGATAATGKVEQRHQQKLDSSAELRAMTAVAPLDAEFRHSAMGAVTAVGTRRGAIDAVRYQQQPREDRHAKLLGVDLSAAAHSKKSSGGWKAAAPSSAGGNGGSGSGSGGMPSLNALTGAPQAPSTSTGPTATAGKPVKGSKPPPAAPSAAASSLLRIEGGAMTEVSRRKAPSSLAAGGRPKDALARGALVMDEAEQQRVVGAVMGLNRHAGPSLKHLSHGERIAVAASGAPVPRKRADMSAALARTLTAAAPARKEPASQRPAARPTPAPASSSVAAAAPTPAAGGLGLRLNQRSALEYEQLRKAGVVIQSGGGGRAGGVLSGVAWSGGPQGQSIPGLPRRAHVRTDASARDSAAARLGTAPGALSPSEDPLGDLLGVTEAAADDGASQASSGVLLVMDATEQQQGSGAARNVDFDALFPEDELMLFELPDGASQPGAAVAAPGERARSVTPRSEADGDEDAAAGCGNVDPAPFSAGAAKRQRTSYSVRGSAEVGAAAAADGAAVVDDPRAVVISPAAAMAVAVARASHTEPSYDDDDDDLDIVAPMVPLPPIAAATLLPTSGATSSAVGSSAAVPLPRQQGGGLTAAVALSTAATPAPRSASLSSTQPKASSSAAAAPHAPTSRPGLSGAVAHPRASSFPGTASASPSPPAGTFADAEKLKRVRATEVLRKRMRNADPLQPPSASASSSSAAAAVRLPTTAVPPKGKANQLPRSSSSFAAMIGAPAVDLASAQAKQALAQRSAHAEEGTDALLARVLERTAAGERLEAMEAKMMDADSREIIKWFCMDCNKWFYKNPPMCAEEGHDVHAKKKREWRFACDGCGYRLYHDSERCVAPCPKCQKSRWSRASIFNIAQKTDRLANEPALQTHGDPAAESLRNLGAHAF